MNRLRTLLRQRTTTAEPPEAGALPQLPDVAPGSARIGRVTSLFHTARLAPWETALHPNRLDPLPQGIEAVVVDASAGSAASAWSGLGAVAGAHLTDRAHHLIARLIAAGIPVVFRWDLGAGAQLDAELVALADRCTLQTAAAGSPRADELKLLPFGVDVSIFRPRRGASEVQGALGPDALAGWCEPPPATPGPPPGTVTADAATIGNPRVYAEWLAGVGTLTLPRPAPPLVAQLAAEATACGVEVAGTAGLVTPQRAMLDVLLAKVKRR